jgi:predicted aspartyl protease
MQTTQADTTRFDSLEVGGLSRENVRAITRDYSGKMAPEAAIAGIIARDFFADGLLVIDYPRKTISFSRKLSLSPGQEGAMQYERPFRVPLSIAGMRTEGNLDTGANVAFVLPRHLFEKVGGTPLQEAGPGRFANTRIETQRSTVHGPFQIGGASLRDAEVRVSERYPEVLVGAHALGGFVVLIDQRSRSVAVCE